MQAAWDMPAWAWHSWLLAYLLCAVLQAHAVSAERCQPLHSIPVLHGLSGSSSGAALFHTKLADKHCKNIMDGNFCQCDATCVFCHVRCAGRGSHLPGNEV
jgi:hypothetical protein